MKYERFTKKEKTNGAVCFKCQKCSKTTKCDGQCEEEAVKKLWELEDKIENGTFIELPCKVGDTVYMPWEYDGINGIVELAVNDIFLDMNIGSSSIQTNLKSDSAEYMRIYRYGLFKFEDIGQKIFLNKAEAEKKLKELQE